MNRACHSLLCGAALWMLAGCAAVRIQGEQSAALTDAQTLLAKPQLPAPAVSGAVRPGLEFAPGVYIGVKGFAARRGDPLPNPDLPFFWNSKSAQPLAVVAAQITETTGLRAIVDTGRGPSPKPAEQTLAAGAPDLAGQPVLGAFPAGLRIPGRDPVTAIPASAPVGVTGTPEVPVVDFTFQGRLIDFLDRASARTGYEWEYRNGRIRFFRFDTRIYTVYRPAGEAVIDDSVASQSSGASIGTSGGGGAAGGGGGGSSSGFSGDTNLKVNRKINLAVWDELKDQLDTIVADGRYSISPSVGTIVVTADPQSLATVERVVADLNIRLNRQVYFEVSIYSVRIDTGSGAGFSIRGALQAAAGKYGISTLGPASSVGAGGSSADLVIGSGRLANTQIMTDVLSRSGNATVLQTLRIMSQNLQPVPVAITRSNNFVVDRPIAVTGTVGAAVTGITSRDVATGFVINLLPSAQSDGRLLLQYSLSLRDLLGVSIFGTGNQQIQQPEIGSRSFLQSVAMRSGETLVVAGLEQNRSGVDRNTSFFGLLGASINATKAREIIVITVRPTVVEFESQVSPR